MTGKLIQDLVGRAMIDEEFLVALVRDPDGILAGYQLTADERSVVLEALGRASAEPEAARADLLQSAILKRWAT